MPRTSMWSIVTVLVLLLFVPSCDDWGTKPPPIPPPRIPLPFIDSEPAWSPDGETIAYFHEGVTQIDYSDRTYRIDPDSMGIWTMKPDGSDRRALLKGFCSSPDWSADGRLLAFVAGGQIWSMKSNGDSLTQITSRGSNFFPAWSPDGKSIASSTNFCADSHPCGVWLTSITGGGQAFLTKGGYPRWYPDGEALLITASLDEGRGLVKYRLIQGSKQLLFDVGSAYGPASKRFSPDATQIAFALDHRLWIVNSDGSNPIQINPDQYCMGLSWSPDGSQIVYASGKGLWIINADGTDRRQITFPPD
jgi:TolB protein